MNRIIYKELMIKKSGSEYFSRKEGGRGVSVQEGRCKVGRYVDEFRRRCRGRKTKGQKQKEKTNKCFLNLLIFVNLYL